MHIKQLPDTQKHIHTCETVLILLTSSSADTLPAMTSSGVPLVPIKKLEGMHTTGSGGVIQGKS